MSTTTQPTSCTDAQKAEWQAIHDEMNRVYKDKDVAESRAASLLQEHVKEGAMAPGEFGLPSLEALFPPTARACEQASLATQAWARWAELHEQSKAHPYTVELHERATDSLIP